MKFFKFLLLTTLYLGFSHLSKAQYVQPERDDTVRIYAQTPFDAGFAKSALEKGNSSIKGVAFTKPKNKLGFKIPLANRIYANKIKVYLFPVTPYLLEYLDLKKKEKPKKLQVVYMNNDAWKFKYVAITNSVGEFTFPNLKPGKYYVEAILPWDQTASYNEYTGSGYGTYDRIDFYERKYYNIAHYDKLDEFVEIINDGDKIDIKLR